MYDTIEVPMSDIYSDDSFNCRGKIIPFDVLDLVKDITAQGLLSPIIIRPSDGPRKYTIVAGHRRYLAYRILERQAIPAMIKTGLSETDARLINLKENIKRRELNMYQEAKGIEGLKKAGWNEAMIAIQTDMSRGWVQVRLMLLELPEDIQVEAAAGMLNQTQVRALYGLRNNKDEMYKQVRIIKERKEAGNSEPVVIAKPVKPYRKEFRTASEIYEFQDLVQRTLGNSFTTVVLGWCGGANSDLEVHRALQEEARKQGKVYEVPREMVEKM